MRIVKNGTDALFSRNQSAEQINVALTELLSNKLIRKVEKQTDGRSAEVFART